LRSSQTDATMSVDRLSSMSADLQHAIAVSFARRVGHDRAAVYEVGDERVIVLADGAGDTRAASLAAEAVVAACARLDVDWDALDESLVRIGGQCTAVVIRISNAGIRGASVGDSVAWLIRDDDVIELTEHQVRKPFLGDGGLLVAFEAGPLDGATLLVASDGLWRYAKRDAIAALARGNDLATTATSLVELVRMPNGTLQDDVAVVILR
jgi:PPM family protein phosphatase